MSKLVASVSEDNFTDEVLNSETPVLVDFWAEWCGPCRAIAPIIEEIAPNYLGKLKIVKCNVDENQSIASQYDVRGIPTLLLFKEGNVGAKKVGALTKSQLTAFLDSHL